MSVADIISLDVSDNRKSLMRSLKDAVVRTRGGWGPTTNAVYDVVRQCYEVSGWDTDHRQFATGMCEGALRMLSAKADCTDLERIFKEVLAETKDIMQAEYLPGIKSSRIRVPQLVRMLAAHNA